MARRTTLVFIFITFSIIAIISSEQNDSNATMKMQKGPTEHANTLNNFGFQLAVQQLKKSNNSNVVMSPVGISGLLAMALLGSVGKSYDEISAKLGFSQDILTNRKHHEELGHSLEELNSNDTYSKTLYADAIFVDENYKLREVYQSFLRKVYHGKALNVNFKDSLSAKSLINQWVSNNTNEKLSEFLTEELPLDTKVVLLSALYFSGQWKDPFLPQYTKKLRFTKPSGEDILVDQMLNAGKFKYAFSDDGLEILALPYNDNVTIMYVVKPIFPEKTSIFELMNSLDYTKINSLIDVMSEKTSIIRFPKMDLQSTVKLDGSLKALGVTSIFSAEDANFALMIEENSNVTKAEDDLIQRFNDGDEDSQLRKVINGLSNPGLYVDSVVHSVKIKIDEFGTEASAATAATLARTAQLFYLNTPFYMFIRNEKTHLVTFSAVILDPLQ